MKAQRVTYEGDVSADTLYLFPDDCILVKLGFYGTAYARIVARNEKYRRVLGELELPQEFFIAAKNYVKAHTDLEDECRKYKIGQSAP